jgi:type VI secretion system protein VasG
MKGEFENRLKQVIEEVQSSETPIILFIDEAHTLVGAGGAAGTGDAANLLKPALARGTLRTVAATTWAEYKKHIEKDPALTRRFQVVQVGEPSEEKGILMMRAIASKMEQHHRVQILDEGLDASVRLSSRYIAGRQLPDKSVSLLDTACARVAVSQYATPAEVEDCQRRIEALETELDIIHREESIGFEAKDREDAVNEKLETERTRREELQDKWDEEKSVVDLILELRATLRGEASPVDGSEVEAGPEESEATEEADAAGSALSDEDRARLLGELKDVQHKLVEMQGEHPLILPSVDAQAIGSVVQDWTGIPVGRMVKDEVETILNLADELGKRVVGQDHALQIIAKRVQTSRANLDNPGKPIGVFMLAGPSGVGKTESALAIAEVLYGGEQNVVTINMSEFQEAHTVSTLKGAPPGYVGYGEGGVLTEAVRRKPYSVVLLDEVEKAHPDVHEIFFQVFDKGHMEDGEGRVIDFKNTLILLTTNVGTDLIMNMCKDPELMPDAESIGKALREPLLKVFPAALLGRIVTIPYYPLSDEVIDLITRLQLGRIEKRVVANHGVPFTYNDDVVDLIRSRCTELESGGRMIDAILTNTVLPTISEEFLRRMMEGKCPPWRPSSGKGSEWHCRRGVRPLRRARKPASGESRARSAALRPEAVTPARCRRRTARWACRRFRASRVALPTAPLLAGKHTRRPGWPRRNSRDRVSAPVPRTRTHRWDRFLHRTAAAAASAARQAPPNVPPGASVLRSTADRSRRWSATSPRVRRSCRSSRSRRDRDRPARGKARGPCWRSHRL